MVFDFYCSKQKLSPKVTFFICATAEVFGLIGLDSAVQAYLFPLSAVFREKILIVEHVLAECPGLSHVKHTNVSTEGGKAVL